MRRTLIVTAILASTLTLTGCFGLPDVINIDNNAPADKLSSADGEVAYRAQPDLAGTTVIGLSGDFNTVAQSLENRIVAPGLDLHITHVAKFRALGADVFEDVTGEEPTNENGEPIEQVHAAVDQVFLAAKYVSNDSHWPGIERIPESEVTLSLAGNEISELFSTSDGTLQRGTVIVSVPEETAAELATLVVTTDDKRQVLSLVTGARLASDVPQAYRIFGKEVTIQSAESIDETFEGWTGDPRRVAGGVEDAFVTTWLDRDSGIDDWSRTGKVFLSVDVEWREQSVSVDDLTTIYAQLEDGTAVRPFNEHRGSGDAFDNDPVFAIPADTEAVAIVIEPKVRVGSSEKATSWEQLTAVLTIAPEQR